MISSISKGKYKPMLLRKGAGGGTRRSSGCNFPEMASLQYSKK